MYVRLRLPRHQHPKLRWAAPAAALAVVAPLALAATAGSARAGTAVQPATVTIDGATHFQRITGFGASEAFGQAETVMNAPSAVQQQVLSLLYSPSSGAGLTILRNEISADPGAWR
jgi:O-glycosyl hydrolase